MKKLQPGLREDFAIVARTVSKGLIVSYWRFILQMLDNGKHNQHARKVFSNWKTDFYYVINDFITGHNWKKAYLCILCNAGQIFPSHIWLSRVGLRLSSRKLFLKIFPLSKWTSLDWLRLLIISQRQKLNAWKVQPRAQCRLLLSDHA